MFLILLMHGANMKIQRFLNFLLWWYRYFIKKYDILKQRNSNIFKAFSLIMVKICMWITCSFLLCTQTSNFVFDPVRFLSLCGVFLVPCKRWICEMCIHLCYKWMSACLLSFTVICFRFITDILHSQKLFHAFVYHSLRQKYLNENCTFK